MSMHCYTSQLKIEEGNHVQKWCIQDSNKNIGKIGINLKKKNSTSACALKNFVYFSLSHTAKCNKPKNHSWLEKVYVEV